MSPPSAPTTRACTCSKDLVIPEVVDDDYRPAPGGEPGARLLVSVLSSRTIPLIRYEMTDRVQISTRRCACDLPFRTIEEIEGRTDDLFSLPVAAGEGRVQVHPVTFHRVLDLLDAAGWQVRQETKGLRVLVAAPRVDVDTDAIRRAIEAALDRAGASSAGVVVSFVDTSPSGAAGKRPT